MVMRNHIAKHDGNTEYNPRRRPRKFLFDVGDYAVAVQRKTSSDDDFMHTQIWHQKKKVGYIDLTTSFDDIRTVMSVHTMIASEYQGLGIAYRVYEGLIREANIAILSDYQSKGAEKLWRKFARSGSLCLYFVDAYLSDKLFESPIYNVVLNGHRLMAIDYQDKRFSPYDTVGGLLLVKKRSALNSAIVRQIALQKQMVECAVRFKRFDRFKI